MSSHTMRNVDTLAAAGTSSMLVTNSGIAADAVRVEKPCVA